MKWEYHAIHINVEDNNDTDANSRTPEAASEKLKGSLSPDFIKEQFPDQYKDKEESKHPAVQLTNYLNKKGKEGWELCETMRINNLYFLIMKRPLKES